MLRWFQCIGVCACLFTLLALCLLFAYGANAASGSLSAAFGSMRI